MGLPIGGLLSIATGALTGVQQRRDAARARARQQQADELERLKALADLSQTPGFSLDGAAPSATGAPAPAAPPVASPPPPAVPGPHGPQASDGPAPAPSLPVAAPPSTAPAPLAPAVKPAALPAASKRVVGQLGGQAVTFDPTQTAEGRRAAAETKAEAGALRERAALAAGLRALRKPGGERLLTDAEADTIAADGGSSAERIKKLSDALALPNRDPNGSDVLTQREQLQRGTLGVQHGYRLGEIVAQGNQAVREIGVRGAQERQTEGVKAAARPPKPAGTPQERKAVQENVAGLGGIAAADSTVRATPGAFGPWNGRVGAVLDRVGLGGAGADTRQRARADVAQSGAQIRHALAGSAVSPTEFKVLEPFIPSMTDTPAGTRAKLASLDATMRRLGLALDPDGTVKRTLGLSMPAPLPTSAEGGGRASKAERVTQLKQAGKSLDEVRATLAREGY